MFWVMTVSKNMWPGHLTLGRDPTSGRMTRVNNPQHYDFIFVYNRLICDQKEMVHATTESNHPNKIFDFKSESAQKRLSV